VGIAIVVAILFASTQLVIKNLHKFVNWYLLSISSIDPKASVSINNFKQLDPTS